MKSLFALVAVIATAVCTVDCHAVPVNNNAIFFEDFPGSGPLTATGNIAEVSGTVNVASSLATTTVNLGGTSAFGTVAFDLSSSPNDWLASTRFRVNGTLTSSGFSTRQFNLLSGTNALPSGSWEVRGFDLRLEQVASDPTGTGPTFDLRWFGFDIGNASRVTQPVAGGSGLAKNAFYDLLLHRLANNTVDIWLNGVLIDNKPLIVGNPTRLLFGELSSVMAADVSIDFLAVGTPPVPEPSTLALAGLGVIGLGIRTRRRHTTA